MADGFAEFFDLETWWETADKAALDVTGDAEFRLDLALDSWNTGSEQILCDKYGSGTSRSWELHMGASDALLTLYATADGTHANRRIFKAPGTMASIGISAGQRVQLRIELDISVARATWYYRKDTGGPYSDAYSSAYDNVVSAFIVQGRNGLEDNSNWTNWGNSTAASLASIFSGSDPVRVGPGDRAPTSGFAGKMYAFRLYDGIGGTIVASPDWTDETDGDWDIPPVTDADLNVWGIDADDSDPTKGVDWDYTGPTDEGGRISWAEVEFPDAPHMGRISWSELEVPAATGFMGRISWSELEVPTAPGLRGRLGHAALEIPTAAVPEFPNILIEAAFDNDPLDPSPIAWTSIGSFGQGLIMHRGRQHELARYEAGTATIQLKGRWGADHPTYGAKLTLNRKYRIRVDAGGDLGFQSLFEGFADDYRTHGHKKVSTDVELVDALGLLALMPLGTTFEATVLADEPLAFWPLNELVGDFHDRAANRIDAVPGSVGSDLVRGSLSPFVGGGGFSTGFRPSPGGTTDPRAEPTTPTGLTFSGPEFTFECWAYADSVLRANASPDPGYLFTISSSITGSFFQIVLTNGGNFGFGYTFGTDSEFSAGSTTTIPDDGWHHVVLVKKGSRIRWWIDGVFASETTFFADISDFGNSDAAVIGARKQVSDYKDGWWGKLAGVAWYDRALSDARIRAHYAARTDSFPAEAAGARVDKILVDRFNWVASLIETTPDFDDVTINPLSADQLAGESVAGYLRKINESLDAHIHVDRTGAIRVDDRHLRSKQPILATFTDTDSELGYIDLVLSKDSAQYANLVQLQHEDGQVFSADTPSVGTTEPEYAYALGGLVTGRDDLLSDYTDALSARYNSQAERVEAIVIRPSSNRPDLWEHVILRDIGDRIRIQRLKDGITVDFEAFIESVEHRIEVGKKWVTTWQLSPADPQSYWVLGASKLGTETVLGW